MAGRALTARECASEAGVAASTTSAHLVQLVDAGLLLVEVQGRHRYYRIAGPEVAEAVEAFMGLAARVGLSRTRPGPQDPALRKARYCNDHLAGEVATELYARMVSNGLIVASEHGIALSSKGRLRFFAEGIDVPALEAKSRPLCRTCLDWSERRPHLAGGLGAAIAKLAVTRGWCRREQVSRAVLFAPGRIKTLLAIADGCEHSERVRIG
jgi:hypothetical protein